MIGKGRRRGDVSALDDRRDVLTPPSEHATRKPANRPTSPWAPHHFYWGIILDFIAFLWLCYSPRYHAFGYVPLFIVGTLIVVDDMYQHHRQKREPDYTSPVHDWYWEALNAGIARLTSLLTAHNRSRFLVRPLLALLKLLRRV